MLTRIMRALSRRRDDAGDRGFTLIELLVVVIIIGILAAIAVPVYLNVQNNAKDSAVKSDVSMARTAVVAYETRTGSLSGISLDSLSGDGYVGPSSGSYSNSDGDPALTTGDAGAFCIAAQSASGKYFAASDQQGVTEKKACSTSGAITDAPTD